MLTFEKIREIERKERVEKGLQKLPENFFHDVYEYLKRKERTKDKSKIDVHEIGNIKNSIKNILEYREHKLLNEVLVSVRTDIDTLPENLTDEEEKLFNKIRQELRDHRKKFFKNLETRAALKEDSKEKKNFWIVKQEIPAFVGPDLKVYKLKKDEKIELPKKVQELLAKEGIIVRA
jgi:DNA replication initiation complex subunit (GINS family)